jgi:predicted enzyme related to lactoylglutathione lyase
MSQGEFVWYELATTDPAAAATFYNTVVGWTAEPVPQMQYTIFEASGARVAGLMPLPDQARAQNVPPHWVGYLHVDDVDLAAKRAEHAGAVLRYGPEDIPNIGRFAVMTDPDGAPFDLFKPATPESATETPPMTPGHVGWHELMSPRGDAAFGFYAGMFGWTRGQALHMGPSGVYQMFDYGGRTRGGIMKAPAGAKAGWMFYFVVAGIDAAETRVKQAGGKVCNGPMEVPGGAWILQCQDPQNAFFALVSATR